MKKQNKISLLVGLTSALLLGMNLSTVGVSAAEVNTLGDITFEEPSPEEPGDGVTKPDTEDDIIVPNPEDSGSTTGPLRLSHVPNFHFGNRTITAASKIYNATYETYKEVDSNNNPIGEFKLIPHFVQVVDERGQLDKGWTLSVTATKFKNSKNTELANTFIRLGQQKIFNSVFDYTAIPNDTAKRVAGFSNGSNIDLSSNAAIVMQTKPNESTTGSKTSSIFNDSYTGVTPVIDGTTENTGVEIHTPAKDIKETTLYTSVVTWTLVDGI